MIVLTASELDQASQIVSCILFPQPHKDSVLLIAVFIIMAVMYIMEEQYHLLTLALKLVIPINILIQ